MNSRLCFIATEAMLNNIFYFMNKALLANTEEKSGKRVAKKFQQNYFKRIGLKRWMLKDSILNGEYLI